MFFRLYNNKNPKITFLNGSTWSCLHNNRVNVKIFEGKLRLICYNANPKFTEEKMALITQIYTKIAIKRINFAIKPPLVLSDKKSCLEKQETFR